jgi:putative zinc finger/helix-turn-helix YgiT family protein
MYKANRRMTDECPICEDIRNLSYGTRLETVTINKQEIRVTTNVYRCEDGKHYFYDPIDEENKFQSAYREYRRMNGLLQPEEIKEIRDKYGLSQRALARFLGWGEITVQRYEAGALQDNAHNNLLLLIRETSNFERLFEVRRHQLDVKDVSKINKRLDAMRQLALSIVFKGIKKPARWQLRLKRLQHIQSVGKYEYRKPVRTEKGELAIAS